MRDNRLPRAKLAMLLQHVASIDWKDNTGSIPAFLTLIGIPLSHSIAGGLALGTIRYPLTKGLSDRSCEIGGLTGLLGAVLAIYFIFVCGGMR